MALAVGLGSGRPRPAAVIAFSGFIPRSRAGSSRLDAPLPPVAIAHGTSTR